MKQIASDKYTIAWFKLAECVARGEREKAFGVYRLLAHSLPDQAYVYQLEADLLQSFDDAQAWEKYYLAAKIYAQEQRWYEAAGIYEHLKFSSKLQTEQLPGMIIVHDALGNADYVQSLFSQLIAACVEEKKYNVLIDMFSFLPSQISPQFYLKLYANALIEMIKLSQVPFDRMILLLKLFINHMVLQPNSRALSSFLTELENTNMQYYHLCKEELKSIKE